MRRKFLLLEPPVAKIIRNDIEPPRELIGVSQGREILICLKKGILGNFFGEVEITNLAPRKRA